MSDDNKSKKDLRARLGRTIASTSVTPGAMGMSSGMPGPASSVPGPAVSSVPGPFGSDVAPPPFAQSQAPKNAGGNDPFGAGQSMAPVASAQTIQISALDDRPIEETELGRKQNNKTFIVAGVVALLGLVLGLAFGSVNGTNKVWNASVEDGKQLNATVSRASTKLNDVQALINRLVEKAANPTARGVDYDAIRDLRGMENPFPAADLAGKRFAGFQGADVDNLIRYYNNVQKLWREFEALGAMTGEARRPELERTAAAVGDAANAVVGVLPLNVEGQIAGRLVFVENGTAETKRRVRPSRNGPATELDIFTPETAIEGTPKGVILIGVSDNGGVLGESMYGAFRSYVTKLNEIKALMEETTQLQGQLAPRLQEIAQLPTRFSL